jgi:hypothetical protein
MSTYIVNAKGTATIKNHPNSAKKYTNPFAI